MTIGKCNPLCFHSLGSDPLGVHPLYMQRFSLYDHIIVQAVKEDISSVTCVAENVITGATTSFTPTNTALADGSYVSTADVVGLSEGIYTVTLTYKGTDYVSEEFEVSDWHLSETILIEYTNSHNNTVFDNVFQESGIPVVFRLRLQGGFKPGGYQPQVEVSTFRTQRQELRVLYSVPYAKHQLTVGTAAGVPVETVELLNNILSLDTIYIDGVRYCRSEGEVPQKTQAMAGAQLFQVTALLEKQENLQDYPNELYGDLGSFNDDYNDDYDVETP